MGSEREKEKEEEKEKEKGWERCRGNRGSPHCKGFRTIHRKDRSWRDTQDSNERMIRM